MINEEIKLNESELKSKIDSMPYELQLGVILKLYYNASTYEAEVMIAPGEVVKMRDLVEAYRNVGDIKRIILR